MELISVPLVTGFLSHLLFIFVRLWLNVQQKCPFTPKRVNTCVKEVRLRSLSCKLYNQNVRECVGARSGYYRTMERPERPVEQRGCQDPSEPLLISAELRYMVCSVYTYIHTRLPIICWPTFCPYKGIVCDTRCTILGCFQNMSGSDKYFIIYDMGTVRLK